MTSSRSPLTPSLREIEAAYAAIAPLEEALGPFNKDRIGTPEHVAWVVARTRFSLELQLFGYERLLGLARRGEDVSEADDCRRAPRPVLPLDELHELRALLQDWTEKSTAGTELMGTARLAFKCALVRFGYARIIALAIEAQVARDRTDAPTCADNVECAARHYDRDAVRRMTAFLSREFVHLGHGGRDGAVVAVELLRSFTSISRQLLTSLDELSSRGIHLKSPQLDALRALVCHGEEAGGA